MDTIYNIIDLSDNDLKQLMEKYKEKQSRYQLIYNEATERNEKIINHIHLEQVRRFINKNVQMFKESKMDISYD
jgi:hypothetical protein